MKLEKLKTSLDFDTKSLETISSSILPKASIVYKKGNMMTKLMIPMKTLKKRDIAWPNLKVEVIQISLQCWFISFVNFSDLIITNSITWWVKISAGPMNNINLLNYIHMSAYLFPVPVYIHTYYISFILL